MFAMEVLVKWMKQKSKLTQKTTHLEEGKSWVKPVHMLRLIAYY